MDVCFLKYAASLVEYNQETGSVKWLKRDESGKDSLRWNARYAGKEAGTVDDKGYRRILIRSFSGKAKRIRVHQLAFFIANGKPAMFEIDHINQNKLDNRACNLRDVPKILNRRNVAMSARNSSGVSGVTWKKANQKWEAFAGVDGKRVYLGLFSDINEAANAVSSFRLKNGFTEMHGHAAAEIGKAMP